MRYKLIIEIELLINVPYAEMMGEIVGKYFSGCITVYPDLSVIKGEQVQQAGKNGIIHNN